MRITGINEMERALRHLPIALAIANKTALNNTAFKSREITQRKIESVFVLKNRWTARSLRVEKATQREIRHQKAYMGSTLDYLEKQEFGFNERAKKKYVPIPTAASSGQGRGRKTKVIRKANRLNRINIPNSHKGGTKAQNMRAIRTAQSDGNKFVFLKLNHSKGIFKVSKRKITMIYNMDKRNIRVQKHKWLEPSIEETRRYMGRIYQRALAYQLRRLR